MLNRKMRRFKQEIDQTECQEVLKNNSSGVMSVITEDGYPYGVPMSYFYHEGVIYFHSAPKGHKIDCILQNDKICFTIIDRDEVNPEKYTTIYRSIVAWGSAEIITDMQQAFDILRDLGIKYNPHNHSDVDGYISKEIAHTTVIKMAISHMTGKKSMSLF